VKIKNECWVLISKGPESRACIVIVSIYELYKSLVLNGMSSSGWVQTGDREPEAWQSFSSDAVWLPNLWDGQLHATTAGPFLDPRSLFHHSMR
jgi:hypothetical protein